MYLGMGATLNVNYDETVMDLTDSSCGSTINLACMTDLTVYNTACNTFTGQIKGSGALTVDGDNGTKLTLLGCNTYTGGTTITCMVTLQIGTDGGTTGSITGDVTDNGTLAFDRSDCITFSGNVSGNGGLNVMDGTVRLTGSNDYSGGTSISSGATLQIGDGGTAGSITGDVTDNGTLAFNRCNSLAFCGSITGCGGVTIDAGSVTLGGANTFHGKTRVESNATLSDAAQGAFSPNSAMYLGMGATLNVNYDESVMDLTDSSCGSTINLACMTDLTVYNTTCNTFNGQIMGSGALTVDGDNGTKLTLLGCNTYTGGTTIACMVTLQLGDGGTTGSITGDVVNNGTLAFDRSDPITFSGSICGNGGIEIKDGTVTLSGINTFHGDTNVDSGATLADAAAGAFSPNSEMYLGPGAILNVNYDETVMDLTDSSTSSTVNIASSKTLTVYNSAANTFDGMINGLGALTVTGGPGGSLTLLGSNGYSGGTTLMDGVTLYVGNGSAIGGGTLNASAASSAPTLAPTGASVSLTNNVVVNPSGLILNYQGSPDTLTLSGIISDYSLPDPLTINGNVVLSGVNTYSGQTILNEGTLYVTNSASLGASDLVVNNTGPLPALAPSGGDVTLSNPITVPAAGLALNVAGSAHTLTLSGVISDNGSLGSLQIVGPVTLSGANTYSGGTTITNVTTASGVTIGSDGGLGTGPVTAVGSDLNFTSAAPTLTGAHFSGVTMATFFGNPILNQLTLDESNLAFEGTSAVLNSLVSDGATAGNTIALGSSTALTFHTANGGDTVYHGTISGSTGSVVVDGVGGTLDLEGTNSYGGGTTLKDGVTLLVSNGASIGNGALNAGAATTAPVLAPTGGTVSLSNNIVVNATGLNLNYLGSPYILILSGSISDFGTLDPVVVNGGTVLSGTSTYSGGTTLNAGPLFVTNSAALGTGPLVVTNAAELAPFNADVALGNPVMVPATGLVLNQVAASRTLTLNGTISDNGAPGSLVINGPATLNGANTYSGGTTIRNVTTASGVTVGSNTGLGTGPLSSVASLVNFTSAAPVLWNANFSGGSLAIFTGNPVLNQLTLAASTLEFTGASAVLNDMVDDTGGSGNMIELGTNTALTLHASSGDETNYHGLISGSTGSLVVTGSGGAVDLKGASTYGGGTTISGGILVASTNAALGTGPVTINGTSAALGLDTGVTLANQVTLTEGEVAGYGTFSPGITNASTFNIQNGSIVSAGRGLGGPSSGQSSLALQGTLSFDTNTALTFGPSGIYEFAIENSGAGAVAGTDYSTINTAGTFNITATAGNPFVVELISVNSSGAFGTATFDGSQSYSWTLLTSTSPIAGFNSNAFVVQTNLFNSGAYDPSHFWVSLGSGNNLDLNFSPVPEPSTWALIIGGVGMIAFAGVRRRRRTLQAK